MSLDLKDKRVWDAWRTEYKRMSTEAQKKFHDEIEAQYPDQKHFNLKMALDAFDTVRPVVVVEIGGWKGDLAKEVISYQWSIKEWWNIEICQAAIKKSVCTDIRYSVIEPPEFNWFKLPPFDPKKVDLLVATHFIEHISDEDFCDLIRSIRGVKYVYFEAPLSKHGSDWKGYTGTHKLRMGWSEVEKFMFMMGFISYPKKDKYCRLFKFMQ
jgi:hypothetical protein